MPSTNIVIGVVNRVATPPSDAAIVCGNSGYTLTFDFDSEWSAETTKIARFVWFSKNKTYSEEIPFEGNTVEVPVLSNTNAVYAGVYAGNLRTTTPAKIVCEPSILCYGQDANMNPSDLALIKGQIAKLIDALRDISVDPTEIKNAVMEYLTKNPPKVTETDPTVPAWAKQPQKPKYTAKEIGAVASSELSNAVNDALAQAKASGEFNGRDGYTPVKGKDYFDGDDYVLTPADMAEIAEMAAELVKVPDSGGNVAYDEAQNLTDEQKAQARANIGAQPVGNYLTEVPEGYAKTEDIPTDEHIIDLIEENTPESSGGGIAVTGAKVGQTVKISAVDENGVPTAWESADFPSGGGITRMRKIADFTTTEDLAKIDISKDKDGNPFSLSKIAIRSYITGGESGGYIRCGVNNQDYFPNKKLTANSQRDYYWYMELNDDGTINGHFGGEMVNEFLETSSSFIFSRYNYGGNITSVFFQTGTITQLIATGSRFVIYGA